MYVFKGYIIMLSLFFLIPAAYGVSIGGGSSASVQSGSLIQGNFVADAMGATSTIISFGAEGDIDEHHYVNDTTGKHSEVFAHIVNGTNIEYSASILPSECNKSSPTVPKSIFVSAQESISADFADEVSTYASASNPEGDTANVWCSISNAINLKYNNYAKATASSAEARQSGSLNGSVITFFRDARNAEGDVVEGGPVGENGIVIYNGSGVSFTNSVKSTKSSAESSDSVSIDGCDEFNMGLGASNKEGDRIGGGTQIINGYLDQYTVKAISKKTSVSMSQAGDAGGMTVDASNMASDNWFSYDESPGGDIASCSSQIHGENMRYTISVSAAKKKVQASEQLTSRTAYLSSNANGYNAEGDSVHAYTTLSNNNGTSPAVINGYSVTVDTKPTQTSVSQSASTISATYADFGTSASNKKGDRSHSYVNTANNSIIIGYSGKTSSGTSATSASQVVSSTSGSASPGVFSSFSVCVDSQDNAGDHARAGASIQNFSSVNGYSGTTSSQKAQVLASESFLDVSALSGIISVSTRGEHPVDDSDSDRSHAGVYLVNGTLDKASKTKGAYSATSSASSKLTSSKQDTVRAKSMTDRVDVFTNAYSAVLGIGSQSGYNIYKKGKGGIFSTSASTASKGDVQTGAKYIGAY